MTAPRPRPRRPPAPDDLSRRLFTLDQYFALGEAGDVQYEYVRGQVFAMAPPRRAHGRISMNVAARLYLAAGDGPCRVYQDSVGALIDGEIVYVPDVMVACGAEPDHDRCEDAPCFVAEVLSRATRVADLRDKAPNYRRIPSLRLLLLIEQSVRRVDRYWRDTAGAWQHETIIGQGGIPVPCPAVADGPLVLTLDEIYRGVTFPPPRPRVREASPEWGDEDVPAWMIDPADQRTSGSDDLARADALADV